MSELAKAWKGIAKRYRDRNKIGTELAAYHICQLQKRITELEKENKRLKLKLSEFDLEGDYSG